MRYILYIVTVAICTTSMFICGCEGDSTTINVDAGEDGVVQLNSDGHVETEAELDGLAKIGTMCDTCKGFGIVGSDVCVVCGGSGIIEE